MSLAKGDAYNEPIYGWNSGYGFVMPRFTQKFSRYLTVGFDYLIISPTDTRRSLQIFFLDKMTTSVSSWAYLSHQYANSTLCLFIYTYLPSYTVLERSSPDSPSLTSRVMRSWLQRLCASVHWITSTTSMTTCSINPSALKLNCVGNNSAAAHITSASPVLMRFSNIFSAVSSIQNNRNVEGNSGSPSP